MSQWIIGGFFAVGIIALLGAIFLGLSERTPLIRPPQGKTGPETASDAVTEPYPAPQEPANTPETLSLQETATPQPEQTMPTSAEEQLQDLSAELHGLHEQAAHMKERVQIMAETVENIEREQATNEEEHSSAEEPE